MIALAWRKKVDEGVFESHSNMQPDTALVPYCELQITRAQWKAQRENQPDREEEDAQ